MHLKNVVTIALLIALTACESETNDSTSSGDQGGCPNVGDLQVVEQNTFGIDRCLISGTLTQSATIRAGFNWYLDGALRVEGVAANAQLTIEKGVHLRGSIESLEPDYIYITPLGSLRAVGDAENPIIMTSNDLDELSNAGGGLWGGLVVENSDSAVFPNRLEYVIVADAGAPLLIDGIDYRSNITVLGDNANTTMRFVQSHDADGDGIRLAGSNGQNMSRIDWLLVTGAGRDAISYENFSGLLKDVLVVNREALYVDSEARGGRAGIYASGSSAKPLVVNATLVGRDNDSEPSASDDSEVGIIFSGEISQARFANILILNYRNACYELKDGANLSALGIGTGDPSANFIDGLHCVNEAFDGSNPQDDWLIRSGDSADNFSETGFGNDDGANFHGGLSANFFGESIATTFTAQWYLQSIGSFNNGVNTVNPLNVYNSGDTMAALGSDINALPLIVSDCSSVNGNQFYCSVDGLANTSHSAGYDLTHVGAIRSSSGDQFNQWTLQAGTNGIIDVPVIGGFDPP